MYTLHEMILSKPVTVYVVGDVWTLSTKNTEYVVADVRTLSTPETCRLSTTDTV